MSANQQNADALIFEAKIASARKESDKVSLGWSSAYALENQIAHMTLALSWNALGNFPCIVCVCVLFSIHIITNNIRLCTGCVCALRICQQSSRMGDSSHGCCLWWSRECRVTLSEDLASAATLTMKSAHQSTTIIHIWWPVLGRMPFCPIGSNKLLEFHYLSRYYAFSFKMIIVWYMRPQFVRLRRIPFCGVISSAQHCVRIPIIIWHNE